MLNPLALMDPKTLWNGPNGSLGLWVMILVTIAVGFALFPLLMAAPARFRGPIVAAVTFLSGLFYVLYWLYPSPIGRSAPADAPRNAFEAGSFWLADAQPVVANLANTIAAFLLGLGIISLLRVHLRKIGKQQTDWQFSLALVISLVAMAIFGYWDWIVRKTPDGAKIAASAGTDWGFVQYSRDLLFDGMLQQMDAVMFSLIAFFILSAAYRAFRIRSIEATVMMASALLMILSVLSAITHGWGTAINAVAGGPNPNSFFQNFQLYTMASWVKNTLQVSSIRGLDFGVGIGLLAMGLRLWLSLEKIGSES